jgi:O-antigen/teichoic acid export membrane protein
MSVVEHQATLPLHRRVMGMFYGKLARAGALLFFGSIAGGILGYVFQVLMGRMLNTQEYGLFSAIMALFAVLVTPLTTLMMVVSRKISEYSAKQDSGSITHFYYSINIRSTLVGGGVLGICLLFAPQVQSYLKAPSIIPVYLLGALLFLTFLPIINNAFLQGLQSFTWLSASNSLVFLLKIIFSVVLVWLGYGVAGAIGGSILATLAIWIVTYGALYGPLAAGRGKPYQTMHLSFKPALPVFVANVAFAAMTQLDMVLVNYYFSAHEAGLYAAASILGKAVMYLPGGIALALYPMVAENHARNESSVHLLLQSLGLATVLCATGATFYFIFGDWMIQLLYGERYREAVEILRYYGFAILPMTVVMIVEHFLIAKGRVMFAYLFMIIAPLQLLTVYLYHETLLMIVGIMAIFGVLLVCVGAGLLWRSFKVGGSNP